MTTFPFSVLKLSVWKPRPMIVLAPQKFALLFTLGTELGMLWVHTIHKKRSADFLCWLYIPHLYTYLWHSVTRFFENDPSKVLCASLVASLLFEDILPSLGLWHSNVGVMDGLELHLPIEAPGVTQSFDIYRDLCYINGHGPRVHKMRKTSRSRSKNTMRLELCGHLWSIGQDVKSCLAFFPYRVIGCFFSCDFHLLSGRSYLLAMAFSAVQVSALSCGSQLTAKL